LKKSGLLICSAAARRVVFREAKRRDIGVIVRLPLASGLHTGKFRTETHFTPDDIVTLTATAELSTKAKPSRASVLLLVWKP